MSNAIPLLSQEIRTQIIGGVLFGSTRGNISGIPKEVWTQYCADSDNVCVRRGATGSTGSHLSYTSNGDIDKAVAYLAGKIDKAGTGKGR
jgi:hypothetical protein